MLDPEAYTPNSNRYKDRPKEFMPARLEGLGSRLTLWSLGLETSELLQAARALSSAPKVPAVEDFRGSGVRKLEGSDLDVALVEDRDATLRADSDSAHPAN